MNDLSAVAQRAKADLGITGGWESQRSRERFIIALLMGPARNAPPARNRYAARIVFLQVFRLSLTDISTGTDSRLGAVDANVESSILMVRKPAAARHGISAAATKYAQRASLEGLIRASDN